ncbi:MAG: hypothetical protein WA581_05605 [Candidatus Acidiferrales bacterium]
MHEREYKRLRLVIEADYRKKIEALDLIYGIAGKATKNGNVSSTPIKGELAQAVSSVIRQMTTDFNVRDVEKALIASNPSLSVKRGSLSNTLKRFEGKELELLEKGSGKRPSRYRFKTGPG